ncbi:MAG: mannosyltransferase family protein [Pseudonocardiaceae bacterium]
MKSRAGFGGRDVDDQFSAQRVRRPSAPVLLWRLVLLCASIRIVLEVIGLTSLTFHGQPVWTNALDLWNRWDAPHYLRLAEVGYVKLPHPPNTEDPFFVVFFPFFPLAVHIVSFAVQNLVLSALIVSFSASVGAGYFLFRMVALDAGEAAAWRAVLLLFSFPTAYFLAAPYSEALCLVAVLASVYAARIGAWARAGVAGALATGTRVTSIALVPALLAEAFTRREGGSGVRDPVRKLAWISFAAAGLLTYLAINQAVYGDPTWFLKVQRVHWLQHIVPPWQPVQEAIVSLLAGGNDFTFTFIYVGRVVGVLVALPLLFIAVRRLRLPDVLYGWMSFILILSTSWLIALPRYLLVLYPLFVVGARLSRSRRVLIPLVVAGGTLQGWLMWRYAVGYWTF